MKSSGTLLVLVILGLAIAFGAATWWRYSVDNPTSTDATLARMEGQWVVEAKFPVETDLNFNVGTGAIVSKLQLPGPADDRDGRDDSRG